MKKFLLFAFLIISTNISLNAQTGKITGTVTDATTGESLIGVNVIVEGTMLGAASDIEGYFVILNVSPGKYNLKASYIGYSPKVFLNSDPDWIITDLIEGKVSKTYVRE